MLPVAEILTGHQQGPRVVFEGTLPNVGTLHEVCRFEPGSVHRRIKMGKVKCLACGEILESKSVHDFQACSCPQHTFVDGGDEYTRIGGQDLDMIEVLEEVDGLS